MVSHTNLLFAQLFSVHEDEHRCVEAPEILLELPKNMEYIL